MAITEVSPIVASAAEAPGILQALPTIEPFQPNTGEPPGSGDKLETVVISREARIGKAVVPYTFEFPADPAKIRDARALAILNGYAALEFSYDNLRSAVAQQGKPAFSFDQIGFQNWFEHWDPRVLWHPERHLSREAWGVMRDMQQHSDEYPQVDVSKFDEAGHSLGLRTATEVAKHKPQAVATITNVEGVGCEDHDVWVLGKRFPGFIAHELVPSIRRRELHFQRSLWHAARSELGYFLPHFPRAIAEGLMAASSNVRGDLQYLKRVHGIGLAAIVGGADSLISASNTVASSWGLFDPHTEFLPQEDHVGPVKHPEVFAAKIVSLIDRMYGREPFTPAA